MRGLTRAHVPDGAQLTVLATVVCLSGIWLDALPGVVDPTYGTAGVSHTATRSAFTGSGFLTQAGPGFDVTGEGRSDVVWRHATRGEIWLWPMNGASCSSQDFLGVVDTEWSIHGVADFDGDARADLFWRNNATGDLFLWTMDGATVTGRQYAGAVSLEYAIVGTGDYDGNGRADLLWRDQATGALWMWLMNGGAPTAVTQVAVVPLAYDVVGSGDVDGDSRADILWRHQTNGEVWLWQMNAATAKSQSYLGSVSDAHFRVVGLADHDADGKADILWWHETSGDVWRWRMDGSGILGVSRVATVGDTGYRVVGVGDYDSDGKADVLWRHATRGEVWVWLMDGSSIRSATWTSTVAEVGYEIVVAPTDPVGKWLTFVEGNPGRPGDAVTIQASWPGFFHLAVPTPLGDYPNGFFLDLFPPADPAGTVGVWYTAQTSAPGCTFANFGGGVAGSPGPVVNGAASVTAEITPASYSSAVGMANSNRPGCGFTVSDITLSAVFLPVSGANPPFGQVLDAVRVRAR